MKKALCLMVLVFDRCSMLMTAVSSRNGGRNARALARFNRPLLGGMILAYIWESVKKTPVTGCGIWMFPSRMRQPGRPSGALPFL